MHGSCTFTSAGCKLQDITEPQLASYVLLSGQDVVLGGWPCDHSTAAPGAIPVPCRKSGHTQRMKRQDITSHIMTNCIQLPRQQRTQEHTAHTCDIMTYIQGHGLPNRNHSHTRQYMPIFGSEEDAYYRTEQDSPALTGNAFEGWQTFPWQQRLSKMEWWLPQWFTHKIVHTVHTDKIEMTTNKSNVNLHTYTWNAKEFILFNIGSLCSQFRAPPVSACTYTVRHFT